MVFAKEKSLNNKVDHMANILYPLRILLGWEGKVLDNSCYSYTIVRGIIKYKVTNLIPNIVRLKDLNNLSCNILASIP